MLHAAIDAFLDTDTEREFDYTLLALLQVQGFSDIHFIHGSYEFGKDVVARRRDAETGVMHQYAIQSKAGNIGTPEWRAVRPQLEEASYNDVAHPGYDRTLPRVVVLLTTGRLKGAAPVDAQAFAERMSARDDARMQTWDRETLSGWLVADPNSAMLSLTEQRDMQRLIADIGSGLLDEPALEVFTRRWAAVPASVSAVESAILVNALRSSGRLDLAAMCIIHFHRGMRTHQDLAAARPLAPAATELLDSVCMHLLKAVTPSLDDPLDIVRAVASPTALVTYPAMLVRLTEVLALGALTGSRPENRPALAAAVVQFATTHPGASRPISDQFAVSLIPISCCPPPA